MTFHVKRHCAPFRYSSFVSPSLPWTRVACGGSPSSTLPRPALPIGGQVGYRVARELEASRVGCRPSAAASGRVNRLAALGNAFHVKHDCAWTVVDRHPGGACQRPSWRKEHLDAYRSPWGPDRGWLACFGLKSERPPTILGRQRPPRALHKTVVRQLRYT